MPAAPTQMSGNLVLMKTLVDTITLSNVRVKNWTYLEHSTGLVWAAVIDDETPIQTLVH